VLRRRNLAGGRRARLFDRHAGAAQRRAARHLPLSTRRWARNTGGAESEGGNGGAGVSGNPPYDRQVLDAGDRGKPARAVGFAMATRIEMAGHSPRFHRTAERAGLGLHAKNLYNDYVYFWRWALWKVFESQAGRASSLHHRLVLSGRAGFRAMRQWMRRTFDELWIIDLEATTWGAQDRQRVRHSNRSPLRLGALRRTATRYPGHRASYPH